MVQSDFSDFVSNSHYSVSFSLGQVYGQSEASVSQSCLLGKVYTCCSKVFSFWFLNSVAQWCPFLLFLGKGSP